MKALGTSLMLPAAVALAVVAGIGLAPAARADGERLVVTVPEAFEIGGQVFPSGNLSLTQVREFTPGTVLHEISVGKDSLGLMMAHRRSIESHVPADTLVFQRNARGRLELLGYVLEGHSGGEIYVYVTSGARVQDVEGGQAVMIASRLRP
jgi:hypothetical protein